MVGGGVAGGERGVVIGAELEVGAGDHGDADAGGELTARRGDANDREAAEVVTVSSRELASVS